MSILINMEMPTSCRACHLKMNCDDCEGRECVCVPLHKQIGYLDDLLADKRRDDCPLRPVPPHGDLIDRDAAAEKIWDDMRFPSNLANAQFFVNELREMPTIIPAEEGE